MSTRVRTRWLQAWVGGAVIGVANGAIREATFAQRVSEQTAHQLSAVTGVAAFGGYFWALQRRWPLRRRSEALGVGARWLCLTVAFEFGFGRLIARKPWSELLADYNVARGRTWPLVLVWLTVGPEAIRRVQSRGGERP
jgi:hypothetical protein